MSFKYISAKQNIIVLSLITGIFVFFFYPLFVNINLAINNSDYQRFYYQLGLLKKTLFEYGQLPLRNPFLSGGYPNAGSPYIFIFNPLNIFTLLFGEIAGIRIAIFALLLFCTYGMFYLTRYVLRYSCSGAVFSTLIFILSNWVVHQITGGDYDKLYFYLLPWLLAFFIRIKTDRRFIILASLILGLVAVEGGLIVIPMSLFLFIYAFLQCSVTFSGKKIKADFSPLGSLFLVLLFAGLLYAVKIIPMIGLLKIRSTDFIHFPGEHSYALSSAFSKSEGYALNLPSLFTLLLSRFLGLIPVVFFFLSSIIFFKQLWRYLVILLFFILLSFGSNSPVDLFRPLWNLHPYIHGIWKLSKYFSFPILFLVSLIGGRLFLLPGGIKRLKLLPQFVLIAVALMGIINMFNENKKDLVFSYLELPKKINVDSFFQVKVKEYQIVGPALDIPDEKFTCFYWLSMLQGFGVTNNILGADALAISDQVIHKYFVDSKYYDEVKNFSNSNPMDNQQVNPYYRGEVFFAQDENQADFKYFSPNRLEVSVFVKNDSDILVINQRYDEGWKCDSGRLLNWRGLLGVEINRSGNYLVRFQYLPIYFLLGLGVSSLTVLCIILYLWSSRKRFFIRRNRDN